jgi:hypothetical protein
MYTEEEVSELLAIQRGNCYVAVLTKCRDEQIASAATQAPEPGGDTWKKKGVSELDATKELIHSMFTGWFNANDFFMYACAFGVTILEEDFHWILKHIQKYPKDGMNSCLAYIQNMEPIEPYLSNEFKEAIKELVDRKQEVWSDTDYSDNYTKDGPYRTINFD